MAGTFLLLCEEGFIIAFTCGEQMVDDARQLVCGRCNGCRPVHAGAQGKQDMVTLRTLCTRLAVLHIVGSLLNGEFWLMKLGV